MAEPDLYGEAVCTDCGTKVKGHLNTVKFCPRCGGTMSLVHSPPKKWEA